MNYSEEHDMKANFPDSLNLLTDTMKIQGPFDFDEFSTYFCADPDQLDYLNPSYKRSYLPEDGKNYTVRLPIGLMNAYLVHGESFNRYVEEKKYLPQPAESQKSKPVAKRGVENIHVVQSGEVLGVIAEKYGCRVSQIKDWNDLYTSRIYEGQKLVLYLDKKVDNQPQAKPQIKVVDKDNPNYKYHVIKPGDTLWDIANMYDGLTVSELKRMNQGVNYKKLKPGDKLVVSANS
jgi:membrane-bound lytic murein transglycosylase D